MAVSWSPSQDFKHLPVNVGNLAGQIYLSVVISEVKNYMHRNIEFLDVLKPYQNRKLTANFFDFNSFQFHTKNPIRVVHQ